MAKNVTVKRGDTLLSIAAEHGFFDWKYVWDQNSALQEKRPDPNVLAPGDVVTVPDIRPKEASGATNQVHKFRAKKPIAMVDIVLRNEYGYKYSDTRFELRVGEDEVYTGNSDPNGRVCVGVSPTTREADLTIWPFKDDDEFSFKWRLSIGGLNPILDNEGHATGDATGIQARLNNLGFVVGSESDSSNDKTKSPLADFQRFIGQESPTGEMDDETRSLLESLHNSL